ncbi:MAG: hypothetical protein IIY04_02120, partial [Oscillospiraceae bacterium]|nr:hypothetical protein [Oscillospiraceae bacterium]
GSWSLGKKPSLSTRYTTPAADNTRQQPASNYHGRGKTLRATIARAQEVDRGEVQYIAPYKPNAAVHIDTFHDYELCLVAKYLRELPQFDAELDDAFIREHGLDVLMQVVRELPPLETPYVPHDSLVREFIGGSRFEY